MSWLFIACIPFLLVPLSLPPEDLKSGVQLSLGLALIWVTLSLLMPFGCSRLCTKPESTEAMGRGDDTKDDGQGKANGPGLIPIEGMRAA